MRRDEGKPFRANTFEFGRSIIKKEITKNLSNASVIITSARETYVSLELPVVKWRSIHIYADPFTSNFSFSTFPFLSVTTEN